MSIEIIMYLTQNVPILILISLDELGDLTISRKFEVEHSRVNTLPRVPLQSCGLLCCTDVIKWEKIISISIGIRSNRVMIF